MIPRRSYPPLPSLECKRPHRIVQRIPQLCNKVRMILVHLIDLHPSPLHRISFHAGHKLREDENKCFEFEVRDDVPEESCDAVGGVGQVVVDEDL